MVAPGVVAPGKVGCMVDSIAVVHSLESLAVEDKAEHNLQEELDLVASWETQTADDIADQQDLPKHPEASQVTLVIS